jgi:hypothetical protein
MKTACDNEL